jgi:hypothetical protein
MPRISVSADQLSLRQGFLDIKVINRRLRSAASRISLQDLGDGKANLVLKVDPKKADRTTEETYLLRLIVTLNKMGLRKGYISYTNTEEGLSIRVEKLPVINVVIRPSLDFYAGAELQLGNSVPKTVIIHRSWMRGFIKTGKKVNATAA